MGVGIDLRGRYGGKVPLLAPSGPALLQRVAEWCHGAAAELGPQATVDRDERGRLTLGLRLHPAAEDVLMSVTKRGHVDVSANTGSAGPGYHLFLCHLLKRLGTELGLTWADEGDETGYFHTGNGASVEREMLIWLSAVCSQVLELTGDDYADIQVAMPVGARYRHDGLIATQLGPRSRQWVESVARDPSLGLDMFPWPHEERDATFYLRRALCRMWTEVRWRAPIDEEEARTWGEVVEDLERAHALDPGLDYPWREWRELLAHSGRPIEPEIAQRAAALSSSLPLVGYRRRPVRLDPFPGWSVEVPGELKEFGSDDGGSWNAGDATRAVYFSSVSVSERRGVLPSAESLLCIPESEDGRRLEHSTERVRGKALVQAGNEGERPCWFVKGLSAVPGCLAICHMTGDRADEPEWALDVWRSVDYHGGQD